MTFVKSSLIAVLLLVMVMTFFTVPLLVHAAGGSLPPGSSASLTNPLGQNSNLFDFFMRVLQAIIRIGIPIAVLFIVWAGFRFVTAQGNPERLREARQNLVFTLLGVVIFLAAALIVEIAQGTLKQFGL